jgi:hypothetical protein
MKRFLRGTIFWFILFNVFFWLAFGIAYWMGQKFPNRTPIEFLLLMAEIEAGILAGSAGCAGLLMFDAWHQS